jgi:uncharacterized protein YqfB (UPF0267 family)
MFKARAKLHIIDTIEEKDLFAKWPDNPELCQQLTDYVKKHSMEIRRGDILNLKCVYEKFIWDGEKVINLGLSIHNDYGHVPRDFKVLDSSPSSQNKIRDRDPRVLDELKSILRSNDDDQLVPVLDLLKMIDEYAIHEELWCPEYWESCHLYDRRISFDHRRYKKELMQNLTYDYDESVGKWQIYTYCHLEYDQRSLIVIELYQHEQNMNIDELKDLIVAVYFNGDNLYKYDPSIMNQNLRDDPRFENAYFMSFIFK